MRKLKKFKSYYKLRNFFWKKVILWYNILKKKKKSGIFVLKF